MTSVDYGLLEREAETAAIDDALGRITGGVGGLLLLVEGEAGVGKTRMLVHARKTAIAAGATVLSARGLELEEELAFGVVRQLFQPLFVGGNAGRHEALWAGPASQAREILATPDQVGPAGDFAVLHGLYWLTANICQNRPTLLIVDDLQWCDVPSLRYLAFLLPRLNELDVLVAAALRTGEQAAGERLVQQIAADPAVQLVHPHPLSAHATELLLRQTLPGPVDPRFAAACHRVTGGNPLLLRELARTVTARGLEPNERNAALVQDLGPQAVAQTVALRMARLPETAVALARAVAILGDRADLATAAALAGQELSAAGDAAAALERLQIMRLEYEGAKPVLAFVHLLVQTAIYDGLDRGELAAQHRQAAHLLAASGADPERVATHLLRTPPGSGPSAAATLRAAAAEAAGRGAPDGAYAYLRRCLAEPLPAEERLQVLQDAGRAALRASPATATEHLQQALNQVADPGTRADIAVLLGTAYTYTMDPDRGLAVVSESLAQLPAENQEQRRRLEATLLGTAAWYAPGRPDILGRVDDLRRLPEDDSIGGRLLECAIASREMALGDPAAVARARRVLIDGTLIEQAADDDPLALVWGWLTLLAADDDMAMESISAAVKQAHLHGSRYALTPAYSVRALGWLYRGQLAEAERDAREALRAVRLDAIDLGRFFMYCHLADALAGQGRLDEAARALRTIGVTTTAPPQGPAYLALTTLAGLERLRGDQKSALNVALWAQRVSEAYDIHNPAMVGWRTEAALALNALGQVDEARAIAAEDLSLARRWDAPRSLGRALRVCGLVAASDQGTALLQEAADVLETSPARLEHAKALADYGAALRRAGNQEAAHGPLNKALDIALSCDAALVAEHARAELAASGTRPRRTATGPAALTPSERRVADLAAGGATNRQIAQTLFVTPKTVEVHLGAAYRKLGITSRADLRKALAAT